MNSLSVVGLGPLRHFRSKVGLGSSTLSSLRLALGLGLSVSKPFDSFRLLSSSTKLLDTDRPRHNPLQGTTNTTGAGKEGFKSLSDAEWSEQLTPEQYHVCRAKGTEPPFIGKYYEHSEPGTYACSCCGAVLFSSESKYDSGSGWPSFSTVFSGSVTEQTDSSLGMNRTEVLCSQCNAHLGHLFTDGPQPTGMRYCINSVCLDFIPKPQG